MRAGAIVALFAALALAGCGGGTGGSSPSPTATATPTPTPTAVANTTPVVFDAGPVALQSGANGYSAFNEPFVSITICAPGSTSNCQTIDHVIVDTGSVGLRLIQSAIDPAVLSALGSEQDGSNNPVGECYQYVNSFAFGSVKTADFRIAGEKVAKMPLQVIGDTGRFATIPSECSAGGGTPIKTVQDFGANGIIGVGTTATDCGSYCTYAGGYAAAIYYDCPSTGCSTIIARNSRYQAPFQQLPNPVAAFPQDNNGTILALPSVPQPGQRTLTGTLTFGIETQADNALNATHVLPLTYSNSNRGPGVLTANYNGKALTESFVDSGSTQYFFIDSSLTACSQSTLTAFYCPSPPVDLAPEMVATDGTTASGAFTLYSPLNVLGTSTVAPGLGVNPTLVTPPLPFADSFDFGVPFFFGKTVYTAIEGAPTGSRTGPYVAF